MNLVGSHPRMLCTWALLVLFLAAPVAWADVYQGEVTFDPQQLRFGQSSGYDTVFYKDAGCTATVGAPTLPLVQAHVALPAGAEILALRVLDASSIELEGAFDLLPVGEPTPLSKASQAKPLFQDPAFFGRDAAFPGLFAEQQNRWDLAGQDFVTVAFYPLQYNPVKGKLSFATSISFEVEYEITGSPLREGYNFSEKNRAYYRELLCRTALNPEDVAPLSRHALSATAALSPGDYEYVIITASTFESAFQPSAEPLSIKEEETQ